MYTTILTKQRIQIVHLHHEDEPGRGVTTISDAQLARHIKSALNQLETDTRVPRDPAAHASYVKQILRYATELPAAVTAALDKALQGSS